MDRLLALSRAQGGVVARAQWLALGVSDEVVKARVRSGTWVRLAPGVVAVHAGPLGYEGRTVGAALAVGGDVVVARESALWWRCRAIPVPRQVHLAVRRHRRVSHLPGVEVGHDLRTERDFYIPSIAPAEEAALDIAARATSARAVENVVCEVVRRRLARPPRLLDALADRARHPRRALLVSMLTEVAAGAESPLELLDLRNDLRHGLPVARRQVRQRVGGQGRWLDAVYSAEGMRRPMQKELDGRLGHEGSAGRFRDSGRDNAAALMGRAHLRQGWHDLSDGACGAAADTLHMLRLEGYRGHGRPCGPGCGLPARLAELATLVAAG